VPGESRFRFLATAVEHQAGSYGWLGMVSFATGETFRFSELRMLITVAKQVAVALANIDLYQELEQFVINVVRSLVYAIEAKDVYTRGHSERVSQYCMSMADQLRLSKEEKRSLLWAAILHDTGKIGISDNVLHKPGALNEEEYREIKTHPAKGYKILKPLKPLVKSLEGILHHHESYGGNGYPSGLKGEEIPLQARIIAVADTYDAITSDRSYRPRKSASEARGILDEIAGTQLDPNLVRIFLRVCDGTAETRPGSLLEEPKGTDGA
jgi:HD-GYP domain-containing protein (c-di-GMP phosphodiesterase class II)